MLAKNMDWDEIFWIILLLFLVVAGLVLGWYLINKFVLNKHGKKYSFGTSRLFQRVLKIFSEPYQAILLYPHKIAALNSSRLCFG